MERIECIKIQLIPLRLTQSTGGVMTDSIRYRGSSSNSSNRTLRVLSNTKSSRIRLKATSATRLTKVSTSRLSTKQPTISNRYRRQDNIITMLTRNNNTKITTMEDSITSNLITTREVEATTITIRMATTRMEQGDIKTITNTTITTIARVGVMTTQVQLEVRWAAQRGTHSTTIITMAIINTIRKVDR